MTDRELLERAAKAAGIALADTKPGYPLWINGVGQWNPLTDDGDALRLAVKLMIDVGLGARLTGFARDGAQVCALADAELLCEPLDSDPYAATRRAIVRAAAAMAEEGQR